MNGILVEPQADDWSEGNRSYLALALADIRQKATKLLRNLGVEPAEAEAESGPPGRIAVSPFSHKVDRSSLAFINVFTVE